MVQAVSDSLSNANEQIERAAKVIGRSAHARAVFTTIYTGKKKRKTVAEIAQKTKLSNKTVLTLGRKLFDQHLVSQSRAKGPNGYETAYEKHGFIQQNKGKILSLAGNPKKLAAFPTKRNPSMNGATTVNVPIRQRPDVPPPKLLTIDDIDSFKLVKKIKPNGNISATVSEKQFKLGVRNVLRETGPFTDWGGEKNDLFSTRMYFKGKRVAAAFGFKGPGTKGALVPGKMGKNGDQIQRLFEVAADVYFVQYWREIEGSVLEQMYPLAVAKSTLSGRKVFYGLIDGQDSNRLLMAYPSQFSKAKTTGDKRKKP